MTSATRGTGGERLRSGGVAGCAALVLLAVLPVMMTVANRSAPAVITVAAVLAIVAAAQKRRLGSIVDDLRQALKKPVGIGGLVLVAMAAASLVWSAAPGVTLFALGEALLPAGAALVLGLALPRNKPPWVVPLFAISAVVAATDILVELVTDQAVRRVLGLRDDAFVFNRSAVMLVVLLWPVVALLGPRRRVWAIVVVVFVAAAVLCSHSGAATLGLVVGLTGLALAAASPRAAKAVALAGVLAGLAFAPIMGNVASRMLPESLYAALASTHPRDRVAIWQSFGAAVAARPLGGTGFGTSRMLADHPVAREVPAEHAALLGVGHPHNAALQVWTELGLAGALAVGAFLLAAWRVLARLQGALFVFAYAFAVAVAAIALVGHGAWQGWWIAGLGASLVWFKLAAHRLSESGHASASP